MGLLNRLSIVLIGLAVATAGAVSLVAGSVAERAMVAQALHDLDRRAAILSRDIESRLAEPPYGSREAGPDWRTMVSRLRQAGANDERIDVIDARGVYLAPAVSVRAQRLQDDFPALAGILASDRIPPRMVADRSGERYGIAFAAFDGRGGPRLRVLVAAPYAAIVAPAASIWQAGLLAGSAAVLLAAFLAYILGRSLRQPILQMTTAVEAFGRGAAPAIPVNAGGEIGKLARAFGRMAELLDEKSDAARRSSELLDKTVASMSDGVLVLDPTGRTLFANPACTVLFGDSLEIGSNEWQAHYQRFRSDGVTPCPPEETPIGRAVRGESFDNLESHLPAPPYRRHGPHRRLGPRDPQREGPLRRRGDRLSRPDRIDGEDRGHPPQCGNLRAASCRAWPTRCCWSMRTCRVVFANRAAHRTARRACRQPASTNGPRAYEIFLARRRHCRSRCD